jgi:pseudouridine-5'-monophosphatase
VTRPAPATHVIFDMDGVLLETEPLYTEATQQIVARFGKTFDWSVKADMIGRPEMDAARHLVDALGLPITPEQYLAERAAMFETLMPTAAARPGARALVEALTAAGVPQAVATSSARPLFELKTTRHRAWFARFDCIVCGDDPRVVRGKPAPDIFLVAAADLGAAPGTCVVVEDAPAGVAAARAAGMRVVAAPDPAMDRTRYADADLVVGGLETLSVATLTGRASA